MTAGSPQPFGTGRPPGGARTTAAVIAALAAPVIAAVALALLAIGSGALNTTSPTASGTCSGPPFTAGKTVDGVTLTAAQLGNAQIIYNVAEGMRLPQRAPVVGIATALQESRLQNLPYGDRDSLGLFQQRPSQGWGTPSEILQPTYAATEFYTHLEAVPGWQSLPLTVAAQDVQGSEFPGAYAQWQPLATSLTSTFNGSAAACATDANSTTNVPSSGTTRLPKGFALPPGTPAAVVTAIGYAVRQLGRPYVWGGTGPRGFDCSGLVMMAYRTAGISLPRTTFQQVTVGTPIYQLSQLKPGDLLFLAGADGTPSNPGHVGLYLGSGLIIEASETGKPIMIIPLSRWSASIVAMRRIA